MKFTIILCIFITFSEIKPGIIIAKGQNAEVCYTQSCNHTASYILDHMDETIKPCDNFYKFSCGKFIEKTVIPEDQVYVGFLSALNDKIENQIRNVIEEKNNHDDPRSYRIAKMLYWSCMNETRIEERGLEPLNKILEKLGGWPVLLGDKWNESNFNWAESAYKLRELGYSNNYIISLTVGVDSKNNTQRLIKFTPPTLGISWHYLWNGRDSEIVEKYYDYMIDIAKILGADNKTAHEDLQKSLEFEIKLAKIRIASKEEKNFFTVRNLTEKFSSIPWLEYINRILLATPNITENDIVIVQQSSFFTDLEHLLKNTSKRVLANYVIWRAIKESISTLNNELRESQFQISKILTGKVKKDPRWKICMYKVIDAVPLIVSSLYVKKYSNENSKLSAIQMVNSFTEEFKNIFQSADWMNERIKINILSKINSMEKHIAYPNEILNHTKLDEYYKKLEINYNYYFESMLNVSLFENEISISKLRQPVKKNDWRKHGGKSIDLNAYYQLNENSMTIPAAILQDPLFGIDRPKYINYAALGFFVGHEITRGFDIHGLKYDKDGNINDWGQESIKEKFTDLFRCIFRQYNNYTVIEVTRKVNGITTVNENIADNGGLKVAYRAYNKWASQHEPEPKLPGLEKYSPQQMFWISTANLLCAKFTKEMLLQIIQTSIHSPNEFRVIGPMSNMPEFARDFECKPGSKMIPENRCTVW